MFSQILPLTSFIHVTEFELLFLYIFATPKNTCLRPELCYVGRGTQVQSMEFFFSFFFPSFPTFYDTFCSVANFLFINQIYHLKRSSTSLYVDLKMLSVLIYK